LDINVPISGKPEIGARPGMTAERLAPSKRNATPSWRALVSTGTELRLVNGVTLSGKFDGEFARGSQTYAGTGTLRVSW
jgi:hypothetical protein